jgi:hypothetical protein
LVVAVIAGPQPKFPNDWTAIQEDDLQVFQGDYTHTAGQFCCSESSNCQVQTQYEKGTHYFDYTHNRTRFDDQVSHGVFVNDYKIRKEMLVDPSTLTCKEYCPLQFPLDAGFLDTAAKDLGQATYEGKVVEKWQWNDTILGIIVMEIDTVLVDQKDMNNAVPVNEVDKLTPFGQFIGQFETVYTNFKPGTPDPSLFDVKNTDKCPMARDCGNSARQMDRLRRGDKMTWLQYHQQERLAHLQE